MPSFVVEITQFVATNGAPFTVTVPSTLCVRPHAVSTAAADANATASLFMLVAGR